jgi:hypothetical protein
MSCTATSADLFPAVYPLPPVCSGDKWQGFGGTLTEDGTAPPAACTGVVFQIHTSQDQLDTLLELTSAASEITLNTTTWECDIVPLVMPLAAGTYFWTFAYLDNDGDPVTVGIGDLIVNPKFSV